MRVTVVGLDLAQRLADQRSTVMEHSMQIRTILIFGLSLVLLLGAAPAASRAADEKASKNVGTEIGEAGRAVGHAARDGGKAVGRGAKTAGKGIAEGAKTAGKKIAEGAREIGHGVRDALKAD